MKKRVKPLQPPVYSVALPSRKKGSLPPALSGKPHESEMEIYRRIASEFGRRAKGVKKRMSPLAIQQRRAAGLASARKRGFYCE